MKKLANTAVSAALAGSVLFIVSCASTGSSYEYGPGPIPQGSGRLILEAGGIRELNFFVTDQETGEEVHSAFPRLSAMSPSAYESGLKQTNLIVDLEPGVYTVVVNTDVNDDVVFENVQLTANIEKYVSVRVGRFQVMVAGTQFGANMPFVIMDYTMRNVLGRGMTSRQVRHFIVPEGQYKIRMENSPTGFDEIRPVEVVYGRPPSFVRIGQETTEEPGQEDEPQSP